MATPPLLSNPSIDKPPPRPEPIRQQPKPDIPDQPEEDLVNPDPRPKKEHG